MITQNLTEVAKEPLTLVGSLCQVRWTGTHAFSKRTCDQCVYLVRGKEADMICLELIYDTLEGEHRHEEIHWVPTAAIQYLQVLSSAKAQRRIDQLERDVLDGAPKD